MSKIKMDGSSWKVKTKERSRGRMKIAFKLNANESEGFKNWAERVRPPDISDDDFLKQIFFHGIEHLNEKLHKVAEELLADERIKKELADKGIDVDMIGRNLTQSGQQSVSVSSNA